MKDFININKRQITQYIRTKYTIYIEKGKKDVSNVVIIKVKRSKR